VKTLIRTRVLVPAGLLALLCAMPGCAKPLLSPEESRSPFDNYDKLRAQYADQVQEDAYGRQRPNLRARLSPKE
jgi:hypothetical protein